MAISIDDVLTEWKKDCVILETKLNHELVKTSQLHAKYLEYYVFFKARLSQTEKKYNRMMWLKRRYFRGEMTKEELDKNGWQQWQGLKPSGSEFNSLLESDNDMNDIMETVSAYKTSVTTLEYILKSIGGRDWTIKSIIDYNRYINGA